ncbi:PREDICTED: olfactory receptor 4Q3-like isoform X2 [Nanorana parkeri]|uniref:olfactory receptor 4Q3-like isoform X2 n=1 Tax=Nanorana parkeri TaxID=125878 RepID=UPI0008544727|nr:PREDICTED: olfactory receptor 4Q3-like isoform X2 [Nanorana parkeri]
MNSTNQHKVLEFTLLGLASFPTLSIALFLLLLIIYILILLGNLLIVVTVHFEARLHSAMYYFLSRLSFVDLCYATVTVPKILADFLSKTNSISFNSCITQLFFLHLFAGTECILLTVMSYDRYVAICYPLRYSSIMNRTICHWLEFVCWATSSLHSIIQIIMTCQLEFCGPNQIDHFFCDIHPLSVLACSDIFIIEIVFVANSGLISVLCFLVLLMSYMGIINTILKTRSEEGLGKAFSTCAAHLTVVTLFFGPSVFIYLRPSVSYAVDKMVSVFYTVITPLLNPIIYTLRNKEVKSAIKSFLGKKLLQREE